MYYIKRQYVNIAKTHPFPWHDSIVTEQTKQTDAMIAASQEGRPALSAWAKLSEAAAVSGVKRSTLRDWSRTGVLSRKKIGGQVYVLLADLAVILTGVEKAR